MCAFDVCGRGFGKCAFDVCGRRPTSIPQQDVDGQHERADYELADRQGFWIRLADQDRLGRLAGAEHGVVFVLEHELG